MLGDIIRTAIDEEYKITEEDIEVALKYLKYNQPEKATRDGAIALLQDLQSDFQKMAHHAPEELMKLKQELDEHHQV